MCHSPHHSATDDPVRWADRLAATSFFNALLRETSDWTLSESAAETIVLIALDDENRERLCVPLAGRSLSGRCRITMPLRLETPEGVAPIDWEHAVERLLDAPCIRQHPLADELDQRCRDTFLESIIASRDNIAASLADRDDLDLLCTGPLGFLAAEQGLLVGHDFHPAPKSRAPFDAREARHYTPEHRARFRLAWWGVSPERVAGASSREASAATLMRELMPDSLAARLPADFSALPMHPWQAQQLRGRQDIARLIERGELIALGEEGHEEERDRVGGNKEDGDQGENGNDETGRWWYPTSSHRSLYCPEARWMVKGSLSARLTNSLRVLHANEVMRGLRLDHWWPLVADDIRDRFHLMQEPAWLGWKNDDGEIDEASLALLRENPLAPEDSSVVLATLTQPLGEQGQTLLAHGVCWRAASEHMSEERAALEWFDAFCEMVLSPLIRLVVEEGIVLLAHQQNIVVRLENECPAGVDYRDCQGSGVTDHFLSRHPEAEVSDDHRISHQKLTRYFPYYVIVNSTLAVTAALAEAGFARETELIRRLRDHLVALRDGAVEGDTALLDYLLASPTFEVKGNFFCYLSGINESTLDDPSRIYLDIPNPLLTENAQQASGLHAGRADGTPP